MPYMKNELSETKRKIDLISFGWNMIKSEDRILKNIGYIFVCKFLIQYTLPESNVIQIFISLLKSQEYINQYDNDVKILNRKALDILIPYLPNLKSERLTNQVMSQSKLIQKSSSQNIPASDIKEIPPIKASVEKKVRI